MSCRSVCKRSEYCPDTTLLFMQFAFIARTVPSAFYFLGIRNETLGSIHGLHSNKFKLDENALYRGAALQAALATEYLARGGFSSKGVSATSNSKDEL